MSLSRNDIARLADRLLAARDEARAIAKVSDEFPDMSVNEGYAVQFALAERWLARGERLVGYKAGLTSRVKMVQMGIDVPSFGILMNSMACPESSEIRLGTLIQPRVEAEIAFVMGDALAGSGCTKEQVLAAVDFVVPAIEIIDSRYQRFKFDLMSVIADNSSGARFVTGGRSRSVAELDLRTVGVAVEKNGEIVAVGAGAAVLDHPANAVALLVRHLAGFDRSLPAGSLVLTGGITEAIAVGHGDIVAARFQELGSISIRFG